MRCPALPSVGVEDPGEGLRKRRLSASKGVMMRAVPSTPSMKNGRTTRPVSKVAINRIMGRVERTTLEEA